MGTFNYYYLMNPTNPIPSSIVGFNEPIDRNGATWKNIEDDQYRLLKLGIWTYFLLLIFEGALRKWFFPSLATPLLIVRDPVALWLVILTWKRGLLPSNAYINGMFLIGITGIFTAIFLGHGSLPVALYGARILILHFPLMFVIGQIFSREDVIRIGKVTLWLAIPMVILIAIQFYSPQSAWVNRGVGGDLEGAGFSGAMGYFRPPGTFSFTNGNAAFFSFVAAFLLYFWLDRRAINILILLAATLALILSISFSISRTLLFQTVLSFMFAFIASSRKPEYFARMVVAAFGGMIGLILLSKTSFFSVATEAFTSRFESANKVEGGLEGVFLDRFLGGLFGSFTHFTELPFLGYGLGMGTNVGSMLLSGTTSFLIAEEEWGRLIGEMGLLMGTVVIFLRLRLTISISLSCFSRMLKGDMLSWMLLSFGFFNLAQAQWAQPTALGFSTLIGGLVLASLRTPKN